MVFALSDRSPSALSLGAVTWDFMFNFLRSKFSAAGVEIPSLPASLPRAPTSLPSYITSARQSKDSFLPVEDLNLANLDITDLRYAASTPAVLRKLAKASPDLSAAIFSALRLALSTTYLAIARNLDGTINEQGTALVQQMCRKFDLLNADPLGSTSAKGPVGYNAYPSIRAAAESLGKELLMLGGCAVELLLNKARLPDALQPISIEKIKFKYDRNRKIPYQVLGSEEISLDIATFFYVSLDQDLLSATADSPVQAAIQPIVAQQAFMNDLRRVARRAVHPRIKVTIVEDIWRKSLPLEISSDPKKLTAAAISLIATVKENFDGLSPEDALVFFDCLTVEYLTGGTTTVSEEWKALSGIINGKISSGAKSAPVILGLDSVGSSNIASTQTMLFVKTVESGIILKLNEIFSRLLTMAVRLYGIESVVEFEFGSVDLRPESELEAFKAMRQSRLLELLSLGLMSDAEVSLKLTGTLPLPGASPLSGTMFKTNKVETKTPESNTSALNQDISGDAPKGSKS